MTEKEKMLKGLLYDANYDSDLLIQRRECQTKCFHYNHIPPFELEKRTDQIKKILFQTGENICIEQPFYCDYGYNITVGNDFYANYNCVILDAAKVTFGSHVFIAPNCGFYTAGHPIDAAQRNAGLEYAYPITVGDNVWFGGNVVVLPGVTIGSNIVIGAGSVVKNDIPSGVIAAGNPCQVIRNITQKDKQRYQIPPYQIKTTH